MIKIWHTLSDPYYGGPEGTSLHKFVIAQQKFWLHKNVNMPDNFEYIQVIYVYKTT